MIKLWAAILLIFCANWQADAGGETNTAASENRSLAAERVEIEKSIALIQNAPDGKSQAEAASVFRSIYFRASALHPKLSGYTVWPFDKRGNMVLKTNTPEERAKIRYVVVSDFGKEALFIPFHLTILDQMSAQILMKAR